MTAADAPRSDGGDGGHHGMNHSSSSSSDSKDVKVSIIPESSSAEAKSAFSQPRRMPLRVAVIGAGPSGIVALKELKEMGFSTVLFDAAERIGGAFATAYEGAQLTTSSSLTAFGDFPPNPPNMVAKPTMWTCEEYVEYLNDYIDHFRLRGCIELKSRVVSYKKSENEALWELVVCKENTNTSTSYFDRVVIATGSNQNPNIPQDLLDKARQGDFTGDIVHSSSISSMRSLARGRRVLIVGLGETGSDLALQAAEGLATGEVPFVGISSRKGPGHTIPRLLGDVPADLMTSRAFHQIPDPNTAKSMWRELYERGVPMIKAAGMDATWMEFNLENENFPCCRFGVKNSAWLDALDAGAATFGGIEKIDGDVVTFDDGAVARVDLIVAATGFKPFDDAGVRNVRAELWRGVLRAAADDDMSLAYVGFARAAFGGVPPVAELQARWLASLWAGEVDPPTREQMEEEMQRAQREAGLRYPLDASRITTLVEYRQALDVWGASLGALPPLGWTTALRRPQLWRALWFGPLCAAQYRCGDAAVAARLERQKLHPFITAPVRAWLYWRVIRKT
ncbi:hypothetical protein PPROV_000004700 [Pycnococcus provasolii]|uniref:Flavin-containing monooxygenase n=1 Tax=Pycnococcus provasolii TaxID=41880 RepID=A0A830H6E4_9CHLO|nr:hypothetical protein PPROV_000004700 [Pycnococcus provasolii]